MTLNFSRACCSFLTSPSRFDDELAPMMLDYWGIDDRFPRRGVDHDPIELLPADPFGMGIATTLTAAFATWVGPGDFDFSDDAFDPPPFADGASGSNRVAAEETPDDGGGVAGPPHEGMLFALRYLGVEDLLSVERVCKTLRWAVQSDPLLWRCIHIGSPLSEKIGDDDLLQLSRRSQGSLQCLNLVGCARITDNGLKHVLESCPRLQKLSVPGCVRLSVEGLVNNLKAFKSVGNSGIKYLKIGRLFNVTEVLFEELKLLLDLDQQQKSRKPRFYHDDCFSIACDDDCPFDIDVCPLCRKLRLVYDCPEESCRGKGPDHCRACDVCIARCVYCGRCIKDCEYVETFCLEYLCSSCWKVPLSEGSEK